MCVPLGRSEQLKEFFLSLLKELKKKEVIVYK